jgi:hypothetical protein
MWSGIASRCANCESAMGGVSSSYRRERRNRCPEECRKLTSAERVGGARCQVSKRQQGAVLNGESSSSPVQA